MAEVQDHDICSSGIKLFGTTISLKERSSEVNSINHDDDEEEQKRSDPTAEKRPDKIIPCPRCKSMETKFCYFNNYNVNQPRHFCKGCQRYWTAGGALRNVPVGAGRRKTKPPGRGLSAEALSAEGCFYEAVSVSGRVQQLDFVDGVVEEWREAAEHGGFRHLKRRRCGSNSQSC